MYTLIASLVTVLRQRWRAAHADDRGATAIEWAIFALLALAIAGAVAGVITAAVNNRTANIK